MISVPVARIIDRHVGIALCAMLGALGRLLGRNRESMPPDAAARILIIKFWGLGNLVEATPAFRAARARFPDARITFLTLARNRGVFEGYPHFDSIMYMRDHSLAAVFFEFFLLPMRLRRLRPQLVIDLDPIGRFCAIMTFLSGANIRAGFSSPCRYREKLYTRTAPLNENQHVRRIFMDLIKTLNGNDPDLTLDRLPASEESKKRIERLLAEHGVNPGERLVGVNVNASDVAYERRWPAANFAELAGRIAAAFPVRVVFVGAPGETDYVAAAAALMKQPRVNLAGKTALGDLAALMEKFELFISNDSGPLHVAVAMNVPTVSFFGPETPLRYGPIDGRHRTLQADEPCAPCISFTNEKQVRCVRDAACMKAISVDAAWESAREALNDILQ